MFKIKKVIDISSFLNKKNPWKAVTRSLEIHASSIYDPILAEKPIFLSILMRKHIHPVKSKKFLYNLLMKWWNLSWN